MEGDGDQSIQRSDVEVCDWGQKSPKGLSMSEGGYGTDSSGLTTVTGWDFNPGASGTSGLSGG
jgi:hypothetical protein